MDGVELGRRLRAERTASGRTIASVAADAGLSVPYIANLENGRGNPTLAALARLAEALGVRLDVTLIPGDASAADKAQTDNVPPELTGQAGRFARSDRFRAEAAMLAEWTGLPDTTTRQRLLAVLKAAQAITDNGLSTLDCHRLLDAVVLITRTTDGDS